MNRQHLREKLLWRPTFYATFIGFVASVTLISLIIGVYGMIEAVRTGGAPDMMRLGAFSQTVGQLGGAFSSYAVTIAVGFWLGRTFRRASLWNGALAGFWMTLYGSPFIFFYPTSALNRGRALLTSLAIYSALGFAGLILARVTGARSELYGQLIRSLSAAATSQDIIHALAAHRPSSHITHLAIWSSPSTPGPENLLLLASWSEDGAKSSFPAALNPRDHPTLGRFDNRQTLIFRVRALPIAEQHLWDRVRVRWGALIPIVQVERGGARRHLGALFIGSATQEKLSSRLTRFYESLTPTLALALEKIHLLQQVSEAAVLEERQRLAREIHDTLAQDFTGIVMHLEAAENAWNTDSDAALTHLSRARETAREGLSEARRLVWALRPDILERTSLAEALSRVAQRWSEETGVPVYMRVEGDPHALPGDSDVIVLRAAQEALANVRKHAHATRVDLTLTYLDDRVLLDVQDNGRGFDPARVENGAGPRGFGLQAMRERVEARGGELIIESAVGEGATLVLSLPLT
ncbi:MAG: sensor histidine kinase [Chloroflexi bacterium]|nr:sensor histidine kinase [Chloroflexota bacterium]